MKPPVCALGVLCLGCSFIVSAALAQTGSIVINEIHYDPASLDGAEFIELYNAGDTNIPLAGWRFTEGIRFTFPRDAELAAGAFAVVAKDPAAVKTAFAVDAWGPWKGKLDNSGEELELVDARDRTVDRITYSEVFPWPLAGGSKADCSIELVHPGVNNGLGGHWRASALGAASEPVEPPLVSRQAWSYKKGTGALPNDWMSLEFDASGWAEGALPIGYGEPSVKTSLDDMEGGYTSFCARKVFEAEEMPADSDLVLTLQYDDGVILWLNGQIIGAYNVARANPRHTDTAISSRLEGEIDQIVIAGRARQSLRAGKNVLAAQVFNRSLVGSSDCLLDLELRVVAKDAGTPSSVTPGRRNHAYTETPPPAVQAMEQSPEQPRSDEPVTLTLTVAGDDGIASVTAEWQVVEPGDYFSRYQTAAGEEPLQADPRFEAATSWAAGEMHSEEAGIYRIELPGSLQRHRHLIRYRFRVTGTNGGSVSVPLPTETQPNFAYFVYDALPDWKGRLRPGKPVHVFPAEALATVPVYHLLARARDVRESQLGGYHGSAYRWTGTLVYDGEVYDHIGFRPRGGTHRFRRGKNFWKFNFKRGRRFQARDAYGREYPVAWDKLNLSSGMQNIHMTLAPRGEHGLFEAASFRLFNLAGVDAPATHFVHFRVIDTPEEAPADQYKGDFNGLYLAIEQIDSRFLDAHELPDGNLYKIEFYEGDKKVQGPEQSLDASDLDNLNRALQASETNPEWWRQHFKLDHYYSYRSIVECVRHYDMAQGKNYYYYHHPENDRWRILPWDVDITWAEGQYGTGEHRLKTLVADNIAFRQDYQNRLREVMDLLYNEEQTGMLIDELAHPMAAPELNLAAADDALWEYHPDNALPGASYQFYKNKDYEPTVHGAVAYMKDFVRERGERIRRQVLRDENLIPLTPKILKRGDGIFMASTFVGRGRSTFAGLAWRLAEVTDPDTATFDPELPRHYEIVPHWESGELPPTEMTLTLPEDLKWNSDANYRLRLRVKDSAGRWSHWSEPVAPF